jgi:hypothetical protein
MRTVVFALAFCSAISLAFALEALSTRWSPSPGATPGQVQADEGTPSGPCKKIIVETDEGYGVSDHETRYDCPANRGN